MNIIKEVTGDKMEPISRDLYRQWEEANALVVKLEEDIVARIDYIIRSVFNIFGQKLITWYFEKDDMPLSHSIDGFYISGLVTEVSMSEPRKDMVIFLKGGFTCDLRHELPTYWLFDPFEEEVINGRKQYEDMQSKKKAAAQLVNDIAKQQIEDATYIKAIEAKLSKEELDALTRYRMAGR